MLLKFPTGFIRKPFALFVLSITGLWGCAPGTLVFNGARLIPIERLCAGVEIVSFTRQWQFVSRILRFCGKSKCSEQLTRLVFQNGESVTVARCQKFLLFDSHQWICAHNLVAGSRLVRISDDPCIVQYILDYAGTGPVWHLDVGCPHTFFISHVCVLTHNTDCALIMAATTREGIIASALVGTSFWPGVAAMLASWGAKVSFSGGMLTLTAPFSLPLCCVAAGGAALGAVGYCVYRAAARAIDVELAKNVIASAEQVSGDIADRVQTLLYQQAPWRQIGRNQKPQPRKDSRDDKPPRPQVGTEDIIKVSTAREVYEFVKKKWRECKSTCHEVMSELSKNGKRCVDCKGPAFRANYGDNPKHLPMRVRNIGACPKNGEHAMYNSVSWKGDVRKRFGTSNGEIVELRMSGNNPQNEYHGYVVEFWELEKDVRKFLVNSGLVDEKGRF